MQSLEVLLESAFPFCILPAIISFPDMGMISVPCCHLDPNQAGQAIPSFPSTSFSASPNPHQHHPLSSLLLCWKASTNQSSLQATCLGCSQIKCRQVSGLRLHLHRAEIRITILVSKQYKLGCLQLGSNTPTNLWRWAGGLKLYYSISWCRMRSPIPWQWHGLPLSLPRSLHPILLPYS